MREWTLRMGLSLIITIGIWTGPSPAQAPPGIRSEAVFLPHPGPLLMPAVPYQPAYHPPYPAAFAPTLQPPESPYHLQRVLNSHGMGCENNYWGSCSSLHYEMRFIFGSCRAFFGDRCVPGQPCFTKQGPR